MGKWLVALVAFLLFSLAAAAPNVTVDKTSGVAGQAEIKITVSGFANGNTAALKIVRIGIGGTPEITTTYPKSCQNTCTWSTLTSNPGPDKYQVWAYESGSTVRAAASPDIVLTSTPTSQGNNCAEGKVTQKCDCGDLDDRVDGYCCRHLAGVGEVNEYWSKDFVEGTLQANVGVANWDTIGGTSQCGVIREKISTKYPCKQSYFQNEFPVSGSTNWNPSVGCFCGKDAASSWSICNDPNSFCCSQTGGYQCKSDSCSEQRGCRTGTDCAQLCATQGGDYAYCDTNGECKTLDKSDPKARTKSTRIFPCSGPGAFGGCDLRNGNWDCLNPVSCGYTEDGSCWGMNIQCVKKQVGGTGATAYYLGQCKCSTAVGLRCPDEAVDLTNGSFFRNFDLVPGPPGSGQLCVNAQVIPAALDIIGAILPDSWTKDKAGKETKVGKIFDWTKKYAPIFVAMYKPCFCITGKLCKADQQCHSSCESFGGDAYDPCKGKFHCFNGQIDCDETGALEGATENCGGLDCQACGSAPAVDPGQELGCVNRIPIYIPGQEGQNPVALCGNCFWGYSDCDSDGITCETRGACPGAGGCPACGDGVQNCDELGPDCGGSCASCDTSGQIRVTKFSCSGSSCIVGFTISAKLEQYVVTVLGSSADGRQAFSTPLLLGRTTPTTDQVTLNMHYNGPGVYTLRAFFYSTMDYTTNPANFLYQSGDQTVTVG